MILTCCVVCWKILLMTCPVLQAVPLHFTHAGVPLHLQGELVALAREILAKQNESKKAKAK